MYRNIKISIMLVVSLVGVSICGNDHIVIKQVGRQTIVEYVLPEHIKDAFNEALQGLQHDPYKEWDYYRTFARQTILALLPADLTDLIQAMRVQNKPTVLLIHNMPIDAYIPPTPITGDRCFEKGYVSETVLLGVCSLLGAHPEFDEHEKDGTYINQIIPRNDEKSRQAESSYGSGVAFGPHTENVYQNPPLKFLSLLCLRSDPKVATSIVFLDDIMRYISNNMPEGKTLVWFIEQMEKPQFMMQSGPSFGDYKRSEILPIMTCDENHERIFRFNTNTRRVVGLTDDARFVVEYLTNALLSADFKQNYYTRIYLHPGDFLIFNNWEVMHARDAFAIDPDNWRWLQRVYIMLDEKH